MIIEILITIACAAIVINHIIWCVHQENTRRNLINQLNELHDRLLALTKKLESK